jgi:hypothetical protein
LPVRGGLPFGNLALDPDRGRIYFHANSEKALYSVDTQGNVIWKRPTGLWSEASPAIGRDGTVYVGLTDIDASERGGAGCAPKDVADAFMFAFTPNGDEKWRYPIPGVWVKDDDDWCFDNSRAADAAPVVTGDGAILFGTDARWIIALDADGTERWKFRYDECSGPLRAIREVDVSPVIGPDGNLYVAPLGGIGGLLAVTRARGERRSPAFHATHGVDAVSENRTCSDLDEARDLPRSSQGSASWIDGVAESEDASAEYGVPCRVGVESGVTCPTRERCSTRELVGECCILGSCR